MPRTLRARKTQPTLTKKRPQAADGDSRPAKETVCPNREANGRFARGNPGGPGNPHARFSAYMLTIARQTMTPEKMANVFEAIYVKALSGDMIAAKLLLHYTIGKPGDAPHPDHIERDEWDLYQKNAMSFAEMQQAMGSLPCSLGNEIVGAALPAMTAARANELAAQLRGEKPGARGQRKDEAGRRKDAPNGGSRVPGSARTQNQTAPAVDPWNVDVVPPLTNRKSESAPSHVSSKTRHQPNTTFSSSPSTRHQPPATTSPPPLRNRVSNGSAKGKKGRKLVGKQWLQPLAKKLAGRNQESQKRKPALA